MRVVTSTFAALAVSVLMSVTAGADGADGLPAPTDLLFDAPHWQAAAPKATLVYRYKRASGFQASQVRDFQDTIRLKIGVGSAPALRMVSVEMFSGAERTPAGPFDDVSGNPVLALFLEHHVETLVQVLGANPRYLKNAVRAGLREKASVTRTSFVYESRSVPAWRIEVQPFADDPHRNLMHGLDAMRYTFLTSESVPGNILSVAAEAERPDGRPLFQETLTYDPSGG
jgi:hypothetical protein